MSPPPLPLPPPVCVSVPPPPGSGPLACVPELSLARANLIGAGTPFPIPGALAPQLLQARTPDAGLRRGIQVPQLREARARHLLLRAKPEVFYEGGRSKINPQRKEKKEWKLETEIRVF